MTLFVALLVLLVVGAIVIWLIPEPAIKSLGIKILTVVSIVLLLAWVLSVFGLLPHGMAIPLR